MKFEKKGLLALLLFMLSTLILSFGITAFADEKAADTDVLYSYEVLIEDDADLLTQEEESKLLDVMAPIAEFGNAAFVTTDANAMTQEEYCHWFIERHWGAEENSSVVMLIDMENRVIRIQTDGAIYKIIDENYSDSITDNIYKYASNGDYYTCAVEAFHQVAVLLEGGRIAQPMKYISNALLALIISVLIMYCTVRISMKKKAPSNEVLLSYIEHSVKFGSPETKMLRSRSKGSYYGSSYGSGSSHSSSGSYSSSSSSSHSSSSSYSGSSSRSSSSSHSSGGGGQHRF